MNTGIGGVFRQLRQSKHLSANNVADKLVKQPQISRFERGKSTVTIDKFMGMLENMAVSLDEFQSIYNDYKLSDEENFRQDLELASEQNNVDKIKRMLVVWQKKQKEEPQKKYLKVNVIVIEAALASLSPRFSMFKDDIQYLTDYLMDVEDWGRFEFWAFSHCFSFFEFPILKLLGKEVLRKADFYKNLIEDHRKAIQTLIELTSIWIKKGEFHLALKYIKYIENQKLSLAYFYERLMLKYDKGLYLFKQGKQEGIDIMKRCSEILKNLGYFEKAKALDREIADL